MATALQSSIVSWVGGSFIGLAALAACGHGDGGDRSPAPRAPSPTDVLTQRVDNGRTGHYADPQVTPGTFQAGGWGVVGTLPVDGAIYAQPLYEAARTMADGREHAVVYVATAQNKVYAFDADDYSLLWGPDAAGLPGPDLSDSKLYDETGRYEFCAMMSPTRILNPYKGVDAQEMGIGIQSTPVIDPAAGRLYLTYRTFTQPENWGPDNTGADSAVQHVAALDLATGRVVLDHALTFDELGGQPAMAVRQRASLLLSHGVIYVAFASHCEERGQPGGAYGYRGAVVALDAARLDVVGRFLTLPNIPDVNGGGIWMASTGLSADEAGSVYFSVGNANLRDYEVEHFVSPGPTNVANSIVRLDPHIEYADDGARVSSLTFQHVEEGATTIGAGDYFTPYRASWHDTVDMDLGSSGVLLPPNSGQLVTGGKEGILYVLDRQRLGGFDPLSDVRSYLPAACPPVEDPTAPLCDPTCFAPNDPTIDRVTQEFYAGVSLLCATPSMVQYIAWSHIHGTPAYGEFADGRAFMYLWPEKDYFKAFQRDPASADLRFVTRPFQADLAAHMQGMPGGMLAVNVPPAGGGGVVFASIPLAYDSALSEGALVAFDALPADDGKMHALWASYADGHLFAKFVPPMVGDGKVFLATFSDRVNVYGPRDPVALPAAPLAATLVDPGDHTVLAAMVDPTGRIAIFGEANDAPWTTFDALGAPGDYPVGGSVSFDTRSGIDTSIFAVGRDGRAHVFSSVIEDGSAGGWAEEVISETGFPPGAPIATAHRDDELDAFVVGDDGQLHVLASRALGPWQHGIVVAIDPSPAPAFAHGGPSNDCLGLLGCAHPAAAIQGDGATKKLVLFVVDEAGQPWTFSIDARPDAVAWSRTALTDGQGELLPSASIAMAPMTDRDLHAFVIDNGGWLSDFRVIDFGSWVRTRVPPAEYQPPLPPGAPLSVTKRGPLLLDVFAVSVSSNAAQFELSSTGVWGNMPLALHGLPGAPALAVPRSLGGDGSPAGLDLLVPAATGVSGLVFDPAVGGWTTRFVAYGGPGGGEN